MPNIKQYINPNYLPPASTKKGTEVPAIEGVTFVPGVLAAETAKVAEGGLSPDMAAAMQTKLPTQAPVIIASSEILTVGTNSTNAFSEIDSRRSALLAKNLASNQIIAQASHMILQKDPTIEKIEAIKSDLKKLCTDEMFTRKALLAHIADVTKALDIRNITVTESNDEDISSALFLNFQKFLEKEKIMSAATYTAHGSGYNNTSSYLVAIGVLQKILHTHSASRFKKIENILSADTAARGALIPKLIAQVIVPLTSLPQKPPAETPNLLINASGLGKASSYFNIRLENYLKSHAVLNQHVNLDTNKVKNSIVSIVGSHKRTDGTTDGAKNKALILAKTFCNNPFSPTSNDAHKANTLKLSTSGLLTALTPKKTEDPKFRILEPNNYFGTLAFLLSKEIYFSSFIDSDLKAIFGSKPFIDNLIGQIQKSVDTPVKGLENPNVGLRRLSSQPGTENSTVLSLEANDIPSIYEPSSNLVAGSTYHIEGALEELITTTPGDQIKRLTDLHNTVKSCLNVITQFNGFTYVSSTSAVPMLEAGATGSGPYRGGFLNINSVIKNKLTETLKSIPRPTIKVKTPDEYLNIPPINLNDLGFPAANSLTLCAIIKFAWNNAYPEFRGKPSLAAEATRPIGEKLLKALFAWMLSYAADDTPATDVPRTHGKGNKSFEKYLKIDKLDEAFHSLFTHLGTADLTDGDAGPNGLGFIIDVIIGATLYSSGVAQPTPMIGVQDKMKVKQGAAPARFFRRLHQGVFFSDGSAAQHSKIGQHFLRDGGNYFDTIGRRSDNPITNAIADLFTDLMFNGMYSSEYNQTIHTARVYARDANQSGKLEGDPTTRFGNVGMLQMLWNYFLLICDNINKLTIFEINSFYSREIFEPYTKSDKKGSDKTSYERGYAIIANYSTCHVLDKRIFARPAVEFEQLGDPEEGPVELVYNPEVFAATDTIVKQELSYLKSAAFFIQNFYTNLDTKLSKFNNFLNEINQANNLNNFYAKINSAIDLEITGDNNGGKKDILKKQAVAQEQLLLSIHAADEILARCTESAQADSAAQILDPYVKVNSFVKQKGDSINDFKDLLPINSVQPYTAGFLIDYFAKNNDFFGKKADNRRILSVGIPAKMIRKLSRSELQVGMSTADTIAKNIIKIKIYMYDVLMPDVVFKPKIFYFDMLRFSTRILTHYDTIKIRGAVAPLGGAVDFSDPFNILLSIPTKLYDEQTQSFRVHKNSLQDKVISFAANKAAGTYAGLDLGGAFGAFVLASNHAKSFLLEEYMNFFSRAQFDELNYFRHTALQPNAHMKKQISNYLTTVDDKFDVSNLSANKRLEELSEKQKLDLLKSKQASLQSYFLNDTLFLGTEEISKKIILPKKFDRVFTLSVDPDEFEIENPPGVKDPDEKYPDFVEKVGNVLKRKAQNRDNIYALEYRAEIEMLKEVK